MIRWFVFFACVFIAGCEGRTTSADQTPAAPLRECDAFVAAYQECLRSLGPADLAAARASQTRESLQARIDQSDAVGREALRRECVANHSQLQATCR